MPTLIYFAFVILMLATIYFDLTSLTIPNWISIAVVALYCVASILFGYSWSDIGYRFLCGIVFLLGGFTLFHLSLFGGGDVKLMAAAMIWLGFERAIPFLIYMSFLGAAVAIIKAVWIFVRVRDASISDRFRLAMKSEIPYGVAIACAALLEFPLQPFTL